jgi:hypothetical protein
MMQHVAMAFYASMFIQFIRKVIKTMTGVELWNDVSIWTKLILSKEDEAAGIDRFDVFTYCPDDGLYHGFMFDGDDYRKVTASDMKLVETSVYLVKNRVTGILQHAQPVHVQFV